MYDKIAGVVLGQFKDKIDVSSNIDKYFNSFTKDELISMLGRCCICNHDNVGEVLLLQMKKKDEVVSYVIQHMDNLYNGLFQYINIV